MISRRYRVGACDKQKVQGGWGQACAEQKVGAGWSVCQAKVSGQGVCLAEGLPLVK